MEAGTIVTILCVYKCVYLYGAQAERLLCQQMVTESILMLMML